MIYRLKMADLGTESNTATTAEKLSVTAGEEQSKAHNVSDSPVYNYYDKFRQSLNDMSTPELTKLLYKLQAQRDETLTSDLYNTALYQSGYRHLWQMIRIVEEVLSSRKNMPGTK
jgi:hypothetical protein